MPPTTAIPGYEPLQVERLNPRKALQGVVRIARTGHGQIHIRVAEDIANAVGWEKKGMIEIAVLVGQGKQSGRVLLMSSKLAPKGAHTVNIQRQRGRSRTISMSCSALGVQEPKEAYTAPHAIKHGGVEVDVSQIVGVADAA